MQLPEVVISTPARMLKWRSFVYKYNNDNTTRLIVQFAELTDWAGMCWK
jgi:hypothetical protein